jgi:hypothetical protein
VLQARILTATNDASLGTLLDAASRSAVLVGRHSSLMAAAVLMRPGTMVFELMPYKWEWSKISMLYYNITQSVGDIHHFAWRPTHWKHAVFSVSVPYSPAGLSSLKHMQNISSHAALSDIKQSGTHLQCCH